MSRWGLCILLIIALHPAHASAGPLPEVLGVKIGVGGRFKLGHWTPIEVSVRGNQYQGLAAVAVLAPDGEDMLTRYSSRPQRPLQIVAGGESRTTLMAMLGRETNSLTVQLRLDTGRTIEEQVDLINVAGGASSMSATGRIYLGLGSSIGIATSENDSLPYELVTINDLGELPTQWFGYDGVDAVVIATSRPEVFQKLAANDARLAALEQWIEQGGHLILSVGSAAREVIGPQGVLARFAPGALVDVETLRSGNQLEEYSGTTHRIPPPGRGESIQLQTPRFDRVTGIVEAAEGSLPLVIRTPRGFGRITLVACDLDTRPLSNWEGRPAFVRRLLGETAEQKGDGSQSSVARTNMFGFTDLISQLNSALDQFPGVRVVPFWIVALLILGYVGLIGPGDYFFVKYVLRRMEMTWITFPVVVVVLSLGAYFAAAWLKGSQLKLNQVDLVDVDADSGLVRGGSWIKVFSPATASYTLSLRPQPPLLGQAEPSVLFSWLGRPGTNWRGMNTASAGADVFGREYSASPTLDRLEQTPIDVWSSRGFTATWQARRDKLAAGSLRLGTDDALVGSVTNPAGALLKGCFLAFDKWAYPIGDLPPGASFELTLGQSREDLQGILKQFERVSANKFSSVVNQARPYDQGNQDIPPTVRMMMFHTAAGGKAFTQLDHDQAGWTDLSAHLRLGRAMLVGEGPAGHVAAQLLHDGQPLSAPDEQRWTFYRIVLPVDLGDKARTGRATGGKP